jgi:hypothetical protein
MARRTRAKNVKWRFVEDENKIQYVFFAAGRKKITATIEPTQVDGEIRFVPHAILPNGNDINPQNMAFTLESARRNARRHISFYLSSPDFEEDTQQPGTIVKDWNELEKNVRWSKGQH